MCISTAKAIVLKAASLFFLLSATVLLADEDDFGAGLWEVGSVTGVVEFSTSNESDNWSKLEVGSLVEPPVFIRTGNASTLLLVREDDEIKIAQNSIVKLAGGYTHNGKFWDKFFQKLGNALFKIEPKANKEVVVETPYLVSVVKGTTFSVYVSEQRAVVNLVDGLLQVNAPAIGDEVLLESGQLAVLAKGDARIKVIGAASQDTLESDSSTISVNGQQSSAILLPAMDGSSDNNPAAQASSVADQAVKELPEQIMNGGNNDAGAGGDAGGGADPDPGNGNNGVGVGVGGDPGNNQAGD